ncbi:hypothetical protein E3983_00875 [Legionella israelensis]|uniref:Uncharacterized protein n=1 Tax=Legionella israelensis TaxID=454 RepID=A0AAX1ED40_9GAMM|nr:hypothetical protein [Legionella israelensis]QBR83031.1 hypothetical protein E3983_00875 [Legionella israelensis]
MFLRSLQNYNTHKARINEKYEKFSQRCEEDEKATQAFYETHKQYLKTGQKEQNLREEDESHNNDNCASLGFR